MVNQNTKVLVTVIYVIYVGLYFLLCREMMLCFNLMKLSPSWISVFNTYDHIKINGMIIFWMSRGSSVAVLQVSE